ncbi:MAG: hypothetical protein Q8R02_15555 [Hyphomonadaceae bacterium]|nr:hypothetical protein [Hyphomonadaceae bacterium]
MALADLRDIDPSAAVLNIIHNCQARLSSALAGLGALMNIHDFSAWLSATPPSQVIQNNFWIIPTIQSIHILAICVVISSASLINLRLVGIVGRADPVAGFASRYLPWTWTALVVLLLSGSILIVGEPDRTLGNGIFWSKIALVATGLILSLAFAIPIRKNPTFWESSGDGVRAKLLGAVSLAVWIAVIFCGRWIAYGG